MTSTAYPLLLSLHDILRWLVLAGGLCVLSVMIVLLFSGNSFRPVGRIAGLIYTSMVDLQVLVGLLLLGASPLIRAFWSDPAAGMKVRQLRFFAVEHMTIMLAALVLVHLGAVKSRRAISDAAACKTSLLWYGLSFLLVVVGIPWWRN
jgi:hypothetical protein